ncbi:MAG TPA: hypothetical protein VKU01_17845 [Bryobacteraceae bacterium]|nr:hypothetical protein [Bryobacteraceae bacterium]
MNQRRWYSVLICLYSLTPILGAQDSPPTINQAWDALLGSTSLPPLQNRDANSGFNGHFFFESRSEYWRYSTSFTGLPTITGVINAPFTGVFNPGGIPYQQAFQPDSNRFFELLDFGTRGWLSDRVSTHFTARYEQDLSNVAPGAPAQNILETFPSDRRIDLLNASMNIQMPSGVSLQLGRQYSQSLETAAFDGASLTVDRRPFALTVFGGRRFTFFADPEPRAIGGANLVFRLPGNGSLEYETLWYIRGSNSLTYRQRIGRDWLLSTYFRVFGGSPVDLSTQAMYSGRNGRTIARLSFFQKLTNKDYVFDYTFILPPRLNFGPLSPFSQFVGSLQRTVSGTLQLGGAVWVRRLNDSADQSAFDTSFQDYRVNAQWMPARKYQAFFEYHEHDSDRLSAFNATSFDDVSQSGETSVKDLTGQIGRAFAEGRLNLSGGAYYRRISLQDRFLINSGLHQSGWLADGWWRLDRHTRVYAGYNLDNDFFLFRPDLKNSRVLRLGVNWKY